jgi:hypothetical protein
VITGSTGRDRIYDGYPDVTLEMVGSRTFDGKLQLLEYVPTVLTARPARNPLPERSASQPRHGRGRTTPTGGSFHQDDTALTLANHSARW